MPHCPKMGKRERKARQAAGTAASAKAPLMKPDVLVDSVEGGCIASDWVVCEMVTPDSLVHEAITPDSEWDDCSVGH